MPTASIRRSTQAGAQVVEYGLLIAAISIALTVALRGIDSGLCSLIDRVGTYLGAQAVACSAPGMPDQGGGRGGGGGGGGSGVGGGGGGGGGGSPGGGGGGGAGGGVGGGGGPGR